MHIEQFLDAVEFDADGLMEYESFIDMLSMELKKLGTHARSMQRRALQLKKNPRLQSIPKRRCKYKIVFRFSFLCCLCFVLHLYLSLYIYIYISISISIYISISIKIYM